eukprot:TRINITY_DN2700_c0_g1_i1.p1 TRINITY_DN2700_c0_g1~~TRINITY_DN2700_c0_g1_i1.p1  ORF type:complete len:317 (+),score=69.67 TRINITY_DN2700_c0_g1_i1:50-952(+)
MTSDQTKRLEKLKNVVLNEIKRNPEGIFYDELQNALLHQKVQPKILSQLLVHFHKENFIKAEQFHGKIKINFISEDDSIDPVESHILEILEKAGNMGKYLPEIRREVKSRNVSKVLERLIKQKKVKQIFSLQAGKKRLYMMFNMEPNPVHTGGPWYNEKLEFDYHFVEALRDVVLEILMRNSLNIDGISLAIEKSSVTSVKLSKQHVTILVNALLYDNLVCTIPDPKGSRNSDGSLKLIYYVNPYCIREDSLNRKLIIQPKENFFGNVPCSNCHLRNVCSDKGDITPEKCEYLDCWLYDQ